MKENKTSETLNLLFICHFNQMRSRTAECIYSSEPLYQIRSAGTECNGKGKITGELLLWADLIFVMEEEHEIILKEGFSAYTLNKRIVNLDILDNYYFMEQELVDLIKERVFPYLVFTRVNTKENN